MTVPEDRTFTTKELADWAGISPRTLRYYRLEQGSVPRSTFCCHIVPRCLTRASMPRKPREGRKARYTTSSRAT